MATQQAKIPAKNFRALIRGILKFRPSAAAPTSQIVNFSVNNGRARASIGGGQGTVITTGAVLATREVEPFGAYYSHLESYANLLPDEGDVELSRTDGDVLFLCGPKRRLKLALTPGIVIPRPKVPEPFFVADEETAKMLKWLVSVAEKDETKPDMCCVYLRNGSAMAGNQKCIAVVKHERLPDVELPLPLAVCNVLEPGDKLARTDKGLLLVSGGCVSQIPYLIQTLHFPVGTIDRLDNAKAENYGHSTGDAMRVVFKESADCVARVPGAQACVVLTFGKDGIQARAQSQNAAFRTVLDGTVEKDGELWLELPEAEEALDLFANGDVFCKKLLPKGEAMLEGNGAKAFFAPVHPIG
jgi:hypothetical protein